MNEKKRPRESDERPRKAGVESRRKAWFCKAGQTGRSTPRYPQATLGRKQKEPFTFCAKEKGMAQKIGKDERVLRQGKPAEGYGKRTGETGQLEE